MRRGAAAAARLAALAALLATGPGAGAAPPQSVFLPTPFTPLSAVPPLRGQGGTEVRFRGHVTSDERVLVDVDAAGTVRAVRARQRLVLQSPGDYVFAIPAPVLDVAPLPGSQSTPGLRRGAVLWAGFSPGGRVLAAEARLRPADAARALPLRVELRASAGGAPLRRGASGPLRLELRLRNATEVPATIRLGDPQPAAAARVLDATRSALAAGRLAVSPGIAVLQPRTVRLPVSAPLAVRVRLRLGGATLGALPAGARRSGGDVVAERVLGGAAPLAWTLRLGGRVRRAGPLRLEVQATPLGQDDPLRPPRGTSWAEAARAIPGRRLLRLASGSLLQAARTRQYLRYLGAPDPVGRARAVYVYTLRGGAAPAARPASSGGGGDGDGRATLVVLLLAVPLAAAGLLVAWAHA